MENHTIRIYGRKEQCPKRCKPIILSDVNCCHKDWCYHGHQCRNYSELLNFDSGYKVGSGDIDEYAHNNMRQEPDRALHGRKLFDSLEAVRLYVSTVIFYHGERGCALTKG